MSFQRPKISNSNFTNTVELVFLYYAKSYSLLWVPSERRCFSQFTQRNVFKNTKNSLPHSSSLRGTTNPIVLCVELHPPRTNETYSLYMEYEADLNGSKQTIRISCSYHFFQWANSNSTSMIKLTPMIKYETISGQVRRLNQTRSHNIQSKSTMSNTCKRDKGETLESERYYKS